MYGGNSGMMIFLDCIKAKYLTVYFISLEIQMKNTVHSAFRGSAQTNAVAVRLKSAQCRHNASGSHRAWIDEDDTQLLPA